MPTQRTLCIIKPDAVEKKVQGSIIQRVLDEGFRIVAMQQTQLSRAQAEGFYAVHRERPFFDELCFGAGSDEPNIYRLRNPQDAHPAV